MKMKRTIGLMALVFVLGLAAQAMAEIASMYYYVQNRVYEDGRKFTRFYLEFRDENGNYICTDQLTSHELRDPSDNLVAVDDLVFKEDRELDGSYDGTKGIWSYPSSFYAPCGYSGVIAGEPIPGDYKLTATFGGKTFSSQIYTVNAVVDLPVTRRSSIEQKSDRYGNLYFQWAVPSTLSRTAPTMETSVRAIINVKKGDGIISYAYVRVPTHMGRLFLPAALIDELRAEGGDNYEIYIQLRTNDNNNRSYSNTRKVVLPKVKKPHSADNPS